jgi:putative cell wall-binding protein
MRAAPAFTALALICVAGCGKSTAVPHAPPPKTITVAATTVVPTPAAAAFPAAATQNTTRISSTDPVAVAAAAARVVFPSVDRDTHPHAVVLVDRRDWRAAIAASVLAGPPLHAPLLFSDGRRLPAATRRALVALAPRGSRDLRGAQVIRIGNAPRPRGLRSLDLRAHDGMGIDGAIATFVAARQGRPPRQVMIASSDRPAFAMPAAALAAWSGVPVLFNAQNALSEQTRTALTALHGPTSYVIGPTTAIAPQVVRALRPIGPAVRIGGRNPAENSVAVAQYSRDQFGWGDGRPGHGVVFVPAGDDPQLAPAAAILSTSGDHGPPVLLGDPRLLDPSVTGYLHEIRPAAGGDAAPAPYNHAWIVGDEAAVSPALQARIDRLLQSTPSR